MAYGAIRHVDMVKVANGVYFHARRTVPIAPLSRFALRSTSNLQNGQNKPFGGL